MDHADPDSTTDDHGDDRAATERVALERAIRHVEGELRGAPHDQVLARLREETSGLDVPERNLEAAATAISEGRREDGTREG
jgi:hypothetical protein